MCTLIGTVIRTARTRLRKPCWECYAPIERGDPYATDSYAGDGRVWSLAIHAECRDDALGAEGLSDYEEYDGCRTATLRDWASDSGYPFDQLGLRPITVRRLMGAELRAEDRRVSGLDFLEAPRRWDDDGGFQPRQDPPCVP